MHGDLAIMKDLTAMTTKLFRKGNPESGQSLVELALVLLFLIILTAGIVDLGRVLFYYVTLRDAAQEGAVYGAIYPYECDAIVARTRGPLSNGGLDGVNIAVKIDGVDCLEATSNQACVDNDIEVIVTKDDFPLTMPILGVFLGTEHLKLSSNIKGTILRPLCGP